MDNPETLSTLSTRDTGQVDFEKTEGRPKMDNPEVLSTLSTQDTGQINIRENRMGNQEWVIQRHCQH